MRTILAAVALAAGAVLVSAAPASATCMQTLDKGPVQAYSCGVCGAEGEPCSVHSWVCVYDTCVQTS